MKKVLFLVSAFVATQVLVACYDCDNRTPVETRYTNKNIEVNNLDNRGQHPIVVNTGSVLKSAYGVRVNLAIEYLYSNLNNRLSLINSAYAMQCKCYEDPYFKPVDSVSSIQIFTLNDFDNSHSANSDISDYFRHYDGDSLLTITELVNSVKFHSRLSILDTQFDLLLMTPPAEAGLHRFKIEFLLSDGRVLEATTKSIELI